MAGLQRTRPCDLSLPVHLVKPSGNDVLSPMCTALYIEVNGEYYPSPQHAFEMRRAHYYGDVKRASQILCDSYAQYAIAYGSKIQIPANLMSSPNEFTSRAMLVMYEGLRALMLQNKESKNKLMSTGQQPIAYQPFIAFQVPCEHVWAVEKGKLDNTDGYNCNPKSNIVGRLLELIRAEFNEGRSRLEEVRESFIALDEEDLALGYSAAALYARYTNHLA